MLGGLSILVTLDLISLNYTPSIAHTPVVEIPFNAPLLPYIIFRFILTLYLVAFHAYPSPAYDGSILFWNGTDDLIQITHINQEDDESIEPKETQIRINERIFGRNVHQNISSISLTDQGNK